MKTKESKQLASMNHHRQWTRITLISAEICLNTSSVGKEDKYTARVMSEGKENEENDEWGDKGKRRFRMIHRAFLSQASENRQDSCSSSSFSAYYVRFRFFWQFLVAVYFQSVVGFMRAEQLISGGFISRGSSYISSTWCTVLPRSPETQFDPFFSRNKTSC